MSRPPTLTLTPPECNCILDALAHTGHGTAVSATASQAFQLVAEYRDQLMRYRETHSVITDIIRTGSGFAGVEVPTITPEQFKQVMDDPTPEADYDDREAGQ